MTASTFLQLFRMLSMYYPVKTTLRGCNVDTDKDEVRMLSSYVSLLRKKFKENSKASKDLKELTKDILVSEMRIALETENEKVTNLSNRNENVVYYVAGYVILKFYKGFTAPEFTDLKK